jgi:glycine/D-amino acid oxidase-like deaminating enzyme
MAANPWTGATPTDLDRAAFADAEPRPFWLDGSPPAPQPALTGRASADLVVVGGGLSGLWAAVLAREDDPARDVVLLEADTIACGASGRNGGFLSSSLTHGIENGLARFPDEMPALERLGLENLAQIRATVERHAIDCDLRLDGDVAVALEPHQLEWLAEAAETMASLGHDGVLLDAAAMRQEVDSPLYLGGLWQRSGSGLVDPARLAGGLAGVAAGLGVRVHEHTAVAEIREEAPGIELVLPHGRVRARGAVLATGAFRPLVAEVRRRIVPVYDYVLVTEPLGPERLGSIGWRNRQGLSDCANQFHYYRLTADDRILFGGYDAVYHYGSAVGPQLEDRDETYARLARHFFLTFPQLEGVRFTHRWAGPIDTCSRFFAFFGTSHRGRVAYAAGHTGLGVGASRFGARVALDLLDGRETEATRLRAVRSRPRPFPPEPVRWAAIEVTRRSLAAADRRQGRRGPWLRLLDRLGMGFDS